MRRIFALAALALALGTPTWAAPVTKWADEFNAPELNPKVWNYDRGSGMEDYGLMDWGNGEQQSYQQANAALVAVAGAEDGRALALTAKKEKAAGGKSFTSARINTRNKVWFQYGKIEARVKAPVSRGLWPAVWMLGEGYPDQPGWPACGEIDIVEIQGGIAPKTVHGTMHFGTRTPDDWFYLSKTWDAPNPLDDWHVYGVEWTKTGLKWTFDGRVYHEQTWAKVAGQVDTKGAKIPRFDPAQFQKPYFLILQLAVGGAFINGQAPRDAQLPATMYIDWVRVSPL